MSRGIVLILGLQCITISVIVEEKQPVRSWFWWSAGILLYVYSFWVTD